MLAWQRLVASTTALLAVLDNELQAEHGLSLGDYEVLAFLSDAPGHAIRMSELADRLHLSPSGITRRVDGLVRGGLVERQRCPNDRRGANAVLTPVGAKTLKAAAPTHLRGVREYFIDRLEPAELDTLAELLTAIDVDDARAAGGCDDSVET